MQMRRIDIPAFAPSAHREPRIRFYDGITLAEYERVQQFREQLLFTVHAAVEGYLGQCALGEADKFPSRSALTGEYYLSATEGYGYAGSPQRPSVMLQARCLGVRPQRSAEPGDYCAVDVTLGFYAAEGRFETLYAGSHVI
jgi:hypothetical protein